MSKPLFFLGCCSIIAALWLSVMTVLLGIGSTLPTLVFLGLYVNDNLGLVILFIFLFFIVGVALIMTASKVSYAEKEIEHAMMHKKEGKMAERKNKQY
jgi:Na+-transporting methylmalonyl-CoA/oxaloacetate decarboxylase gamma subunit